MKIVKSIVELTQLRNTFTGSIGFIPTMGALHKGHLSLVNESNKKCDHTIVSIFVNPKQFAPNEDFDNYPRIIEKDIEKLKLFNIDLLFIPSSDEIYNSAYSTIIYENEMFKILEGASRPHFFKGVCDVVARLFDIIKPTDAFFGEKDFQQLRIIEKMAVDLNYNVNIISCPIIREYNGLAMSSRNEYLTSKNRSKSKIIFHTLQLGVELIYYGEKNIKNIYDKLIGKLNLEPAITIDYIKVVNYSTLFEFSDVINDDFLICIAVYMDKTRLIDNISYLYKKSSSI